MERIFQTQNTQKLQDERPGRRTSETSVGWTSRCIRIAGLDSIPVGVSSERGVDSDSIRAQRERKRRCSETESHESGSGRRRKKKTRCQGQDISSRGAFTLALNA